MHLHVYIEPYVYTCFFLPIYPQPLDARTTKELETVLKGFLEPKQVLKLETKVRVYTHFEFEYFLEYTSPSVGNPEIITLHYRVPCDPCPRSLLL